MSRFAAVLLTGILLGIGFGGCDTSSGSLPTVTILEPGTSVEFDTLLIGEPFRVNAEISGAQGLEAVEFELTYFPSGGNPLFLHRLDVMPTHANPYVIDTTFVVPADAQPSDVIGHAATLKITAFGDGGTSGVNAFVLLVAPESVP